MSKQLLNNNHKASVIIYTLILVNIGLVMAIVVLSNTFLLESNHAFTSLNKQLFSNIRSKSSLAFKYTNHLNSNGGGYIDQVSCPQSVSMSGSTLAGFVNTQMVFSGSIYCSGTYQGEELALYFQSGSTDFSHAGYKNYLILLTNNIGTFNDTDSTNINFSSHVHSIDNIDDNMDSDNYTIYSTGTYLYSNSYFDDDTQARSNIYGYISPNLDFQNVFWLNDSIINYIDSNPHNTDSINVKPNALSMNLKLDIDKPFYLKLVEFDKQAYNQRGELLVLNEYESYQIPAGIGYIQNDMTFTGNITGNEYTLDSSQKDYALFIKTDAQGVLLYKIMGVQEQTGKTIYINPIDDSMPILRILGYDILYTEGKYIGKTLEVIGKKN